MRKDLNLIGEKYHFILLRENAEVNKFASWAHEEWRKGWEKQQGGPRVKKNSDGTEGDINVPFDKLHPDWQKENLAAGKAAFEAVQKFPDDEEAAADFIHQQWMERNPKQAWNAAQHVSYKQLPESEKEKDRVHVRVMKQILNGR